MLANLAASIIKHEKVRTTEAKAKEIRPFVERLVSFARRGDLHARRIVLSRLKGDKDAVQKLFDEIGPRYTSRPGGYTRILKLGFRAGDNSAMSLIEFVKDEDTKPAKKSRPKKKAAPKAAPAVEKVEAVETEAPAEVVEEATEAVETADEETVEVEEAPAEAAAEEAPAEEPVAEAAPAEEEKKEDAAGEDK